MNAEQQTTTIVFLTKKPPVDLFNYDIDHSEEDKLLVEAERKAFSHQYSRKISLKGLVTDAVVDREVARQNGYAPIFTIRSKNIGTYRQKLGEMENLPHSVFRPDF